MLSPDLKKQVKSVCLCVLALGALEFAASFALSLFFEVSLLRALAGDALGCFTAILSFYLLAVSVEKSVQKSSKNAQAFMSLTYMGRLALTAAAVMTAILLPKVFNLWTTVIPLVFPRLAIMLTKTRTKNESINEGDEKLER